MARPQAGQGDLDALNIHAAWDGAGADVGGNVVAEGVAQVSTQVSKGTLAGGLSLQHHNSINIMSVATCSLAVHSSGHGATFEGWYR